MKILSPKMTSAVFAVFVFLGAFLMSGGTVNAQNEGNGAKVTVTGKVTDEKGGPLPGATVIVKGTQTGVSTDSDGRFSLSFVPKDNDILQISFISMSTQEISWKSARNGIIVVLKDDENYLKDVVVTGYSKIKRSNFTGTSTTISNEDIVKVSPGNVLKSLSAFDPSFKAIADNVSGSNPNKMSEYYVRGRSGISEISELDIATSEDVSEFSLKNNPSTPVFILDGFEVDQATIYDLDVNRIHSMTLLKDAAATAVYGSRAANGVIVIETVTPEVGQVKVNYSTTLSLSTPDLSSYHLMNAKEALEAEWYADLYQKATDSGKSAGGLINYYNLYNNVVRGVNTDWIAKPLRTSFSNKHYLALSGGSESLRWQADINYQSKDGVMKGSDRDSYGAAMTLDYRWKKLQVKNKFSFNVVDSQDSPYGEFSDYYHMKPYLDPINDETGEYYKTFNIYRNIRSSVSNPTYVENPLYEANLNSFSKSQYHEFMDNFGLNWNITPYLMVKGTFSASFKAQDDDKFVDPLSGSFVSTTDIMRKGSYRDNDLRFNKWTAGGLIAYNRTLAGHNINATLGFEAAQNFSTSVIANYRGFAYGAKGASSNALEIIDKPSFTDSKTRRAGSYLIANYSYKDIYLLDLSGRYEGSSTFGAKKKMGAFWSAGAGINFHNYGFLKDTQWIDRLKLKATYGVTGKSNFSPYQARTTFDINYDMPYIDQWGMTLKALGNENLKWEKVNKSDIGVEAAFFGNRLSFQFDYYHELTVDQIESISLPASSGFKSYKGNLGAVLNQGEDLKITGKVVSTHDWDVYLFGNFNHNTNTIQKLGLALQEYNESIDAFYATYSSNSSDEKFSQSFTKYEVGNSLSAIYGMKSLGIDPATGKELYEKRDGTVTYDWSSEEQQSLGDSDPLLSGTFGFNVRWKHWTLYSTFAFHCGGQKYNYTLAGIENINLEKYNGDIRILTDRWKEPGDFSTLKSIKDRTYTTLPTSRFVQNDNELTFNSISLGYDFDKAMLKKHGISGLKLQFNTEDLLYLSTIRRERGTSYPYARLWNLSVNLTF